MKYWGVMLILMISFSSAGIDGIIGLDLNTPAATFNNETAFVNNSQYWDRTGTVLSPVNTGEMIKKIFVLSLIS